MNQLRFRLATPYMYVHVPTSSFETPFHGADLTIYSYFPPCALFLRRDYHAGVARES